MSENESDYLSESESGDEEVTLIEPSKKAVYDREGLLAKLDDIIKWSENVEWNQTLAIDHNQEQEVDVNDDIVRELAFYTQALEGTRLAFGKIEKLGIPFFRPADYYAEMVKTDAHMMKVKGKLLFQKQKIEEADERKKAREAKKIAKEVQAQKLKERAKAKKEDIESVKKWRKQRQRSGYARGQQDELDALFDGNGMSSNVSKKNRPGVALGDRSGGKFNKRLNKKRENRDTRFGYGGRKGMKKQNTAETTNDFRDFNKGKFLGKKRKRK